MQAIVRQPGRTVNITNGGSALAAGQVVVIGDLVGVTTYPVAANALYALTVEGVAEVVKIDDNMSTAGVTIYWNATGNPVGGTAGTGGATTTASTHKKLGLSIAVAGAAAGTVQVLLGARA